MPGKKNKCNCEERVKVLEENLLLLQNLLVKGSVLVEGDLLVKGKITDEKGGLPNIGQGGDANICTATLTPVVFDINAPQPPCRIITQEDFVVGASRVLFGKQTNGLFTFNNKSLFHTIDIYDIGSAAIAPVFQVHRRTQVKITFKDGAISSIQEPIPI